MNRKAMALKEKMEQLGVSRAELLPVKEITFDRELRKSCEANRCGLFGKNWTCPPLCGGVDEMIAEANTYRTAVVFQNIYQISDSFDIEGMEEASRRHKELVRSIYENPAMPREGLMMGAGGCDFCESCAARDNEPCRYPDKAFASLEAYGVYVSQLAKACGMKYINGVNTITYFGAVLLPE